MITSSYPGIFGCVLAVFLASSTSRADQFHYRNVLIGDRAAGLGGSYTAISDDPSGIFFNPAGMIYGFENYFSASANSYNVTNTTYKNVAGGQDYVLSSSGLVPSFFGFMQGMGKGKFAFGIAVPNSDATDQDDKLTEISNAPGAVNTFKRKYFEQDTTYLIGPAYSQSINDKMAWGFSLLGFYRSGLMINNQTLLYNPVPDGKYFLANSYFHQFAYGIQPRLGLQYMVANSISIGATVSKNFNLGGSISGHTDATKFTGTPSGVYSADFDKSDFKSSFGAPDPWTFELGFGFFPNKTFLISSDLAFYTGVANSKSKFTIAPTWNASLGSEIYFSDSIAIRAGIFSNNANTLALSATLTDQPPHVNLIGGSLSLAFFKSGSSLSVGAIYTRGTGQGQVVGDVTQSQTIQQSSLAMSLTGSYQL